MSTGSSIEELSGRIAVNAQRLSTFLRCNCLQHPSFERSCPTNTIPAGAPAKIVVAQQDLAEDALMLFRLTVGPSEFLATMAVRYQQLASLQWLCHFQIPSLVPLHGALSYSELAAKASVPERPLKSFARMAMTEGVFMEKSPNQITHSAISALMQVDTGYASWARYMADFSMPTALNTVEATTRWGDTLAGNQTAFNAAFGTNLPFFEFLGKNNDLNKLFAGYMKSAGNSQGTSVKHLLDGFDWSGLGDGVVVDVGGSTGHTSVALALAHPGLKFVIQDHPPVVAEGEALLKDIPDHISSRVSFQAHDFFEPQPVIGAKVYLLRMILHDWPDHKAIAILRSLVPALRAGSKTILMDSVLPAPGSILPYRESLIRFRDIIMRQVFNSQERSEEDWVCLIKKADPRLKLKRTRLPAGSILSVMEVELEL